MRQKQTAFILSVFLSLTAIQASAIDLPEVLVTTRPLTPGTVVLDEKDIASTPGDGLADLLLWSGETDVDRRGPAQADLSTRASTFEQTGLFLDGFPVNDPQTGHFNLEVPFPTEDLSSVEISPVSWGSMGLSGSLNLVPKTPNEPTASVSSSAGSFNTVHSDGRLCLPPASLWCDYSHSDGYREDTDSLDREAGGLFSLNDLLDSHAFLSYGDKKFGAHDFYGSFPGYDEWEQTQNLLAAWRAQIEGSSGDWDPGFYWRRHRDHFMLDRSDPSLYENFHTTQTGGFDNRYALGDFRGHFFGRGEWLDSSSLGKTDRFSTGLSGLMESKAGSLGLELTALGQGRYQASPILSARIDPLQSIQVTGSVSRAYRLPSFTELYYTDPQNQGNADLKPESAWNFEVSPQWRSGRLSVKADGFVRLEKDLIDWARADSSDPWQSMNIGHDAVQGAGIKAEWKTAPVRLQAGYDALYRKADLDGLQSKYALNFPRNKVELKGDGDWGRLGWSLGAARLWRTDQKPYTLVEAKLSIKARHGSVFASVANALNADYQEVGGVPMPGRAFEGGINLTF